MEKTKKLAVGILAHVDAGKTTLAEGILYKTGQIRKAGRVDHKDAFLDTEELEKARGITIFSKQAVLKLNETEVTLLDTPGHVDFSAEMERTLQVMDYAVLLISGADGVQVHNAHGAEDAVLSGRAQGGARGNRDSALPGRRRVLAQDRGGNSCTGFPARVDEPRAHLRAGLCRKAQKRRAGREQMPCLQRLLHDLPQALCALRAASRRDRAVQNHSVVNEI